MNTSSASDGYRDPQRWKQMEALLDVIDALDPQEVPEYLKRACVDDPLLAEQVLRFWQRAQGAADLLEAPILDGLHLLLDEESRLSSELANIPDCRVLEKIGEGGMGRVYLVEQNTPARRLVALKVLTSAYSSELLKRFQLELGALARMDHENVARLYQFGFTPDRQIPFYLMEYFPGVPITEFAQQHHLALDQRLQLMLQVLQGVQHAHQKGLIHRDIKPSNILVASKDGRTQVKLIDFGIAKALGEDAIKSEALTEAGHVLGTPCYMSPEQWDPGSESLDIRSDIYSLGAVLYELVSGRPIVDSEALRGLPLSGKIAHLRKNRPLLPSKISFDLPRDLDWVFERATCLDKAERYQSIFHFAADLEAILAHRPVTARPKFSAWYIARKFLRRHRQGVVLGVVAFVILALFTGLSIRSHLRNQAAERRTQDAFLVLGTALATPNIRLQGAGVTLVDALKTLAETMPKKLDPLVRAKVLTTMAETLSSLDDNEQALCFATEAAELLTLDFADPRDIAANQLVLARIHQLAGDLDLAEPLYTAALNSGELGQYKESRAQSGRAEVFRLSGLPELAIPIYEALPEDEFNTKGQIARWRGLADCYASVGATEEAIAMFDWALQVANRAFGESSADALTTRIMYYHHLRQLGRLDAAASKLGILFNQAKQRFGMHHRLTLDAWLALTSAELAEACVVSPTERPEHILAIAEELDAPPVTWRVSLMASSTLRHQGRLEQAETVLEQLLDRQWARTGWADEDLLRTASNLADLYTVNGRPELGIAFLSDLLVARRNHQLSMGDADFIAHVTLAEALLALNRKAEAKKALLPLRLDRPLDQWEWRGSRDFKAYVKSLLVHTHP